MAKAKWTDYDLGVKLKARTKWWTRDGQQRYIRLYAAYRNMHGRCNGWTSAGSGAQPWKGLPVEFYDWIHFRDWSIKNGYSKINCSLDRRDARFGYSPTNCRWITCGQNTQFMHRAKWLRENRIRSKIT